MIKINESTIQKWLVPEGWKKLDMNFNDELLRYVSQNGRYVLEETYCSNLCSEDEAGWGLHIDDSRMCGLAQCDVEYIEQIYDLIEIYKNY